MDKSLGKIIEIIPNRLHWLSDDQPHDGIENSFFFCIDKELKYIPYFLDFGPFTIAQVFRFVTELEKMLNKEESKSIDIYHYTSSAASERLNAAFLMGAFMVI
jgi:cell division cycle 14